MEYFSATAARSSSSARRNAPASSDSRLMRRRYSVAARDDSLTRADAASTIEGGKPKRPAISIPEDDPA
ncbi:MAG: hypothetical protein LC747_01105, partial [Acidobacteria bacterium]|nr:hypothetical protein [Acidobacteriota bacterium]